MQKYQSNQLLQEVLTLADVVTGVTIQKTAVKN